MSLDDHLAVPLVRRDPGPEAGEGGQEPAEAADHRGGPCVRSRCRCSVAVCGVSPLESPHLLTTAGPVVAHSYTRTGTLTGTLAHTGDKQRISAGPLRSADR